MIRIVLVGILIIISYVLQTAFALDLSFGVAAPNILMIFVCCYALLRGKREGMIVGFFSGMLIDIFYGYYEIIGISALIFLLIGFLVGIFHEILYLQDILIPIVAVTICDFVYNTIYYAITFMLRNKLDFAYYMKAIIVPELVYTVFLTVFIYRVLMFCNNKLEAFEMRGNEEID